MKTYTLEELKLAQAKKCRIETVTTEGVWRTVEKPQLLEFLFEVTPEYCRIHHADEWKARLPRLREGAEWCCDGNGYEKARPHIVGETLKKDNVFGRANKGCRIMTTAPVPPEFLHPDELAKQPEASQAPDFGEPWQPSCEMIFDRDGDYVAEFQPPFHDSSKVAARAIACVNALAGVPDPAEFVRQAMEMREAIKLAHAFIERHTYSDHAEDCLAMCGPGAECDCGKFQERREIISKLKPFLP
jgi:hypothetical protein